MTLAEKDFEMYLEKYCKTYRCTSEEAKKHLLVQEVKSYYEEQYKGQQ